MIRVSVEGTGLRICGHAGGAPMGENLVCAAVTALVYALAQRLTELEVTGAFEQPPRIRLDSGDAQITVFPQAPRRAEVEGAFRLIESGLKLLARHYPAQIRIEVIETLPAVGRARSPEGAFEKT